VETASFAASGTVTVVRGGYAVTEELQITMDEKGIIIPNLALAGYRSFGKEPQYFDHFAKINLFIGQNNAGKSNVLRFLSEVYPHAPEVSRNNLYQAKKLPLDALDKHFPDNPPLVLGIGERVDYDELPCHHKLLAKIDKEKRQIYIQNKHVSIESLALKIMKEKATIDNKSLCWTLINLLTSENRKIEESWLNAANILPDTELSKLWTALTGMTGGGRKQHWEPETIARMQLSPVQIKAQIIPAIRRIGEKGSSSDAFDGTGIIDRLARLQNPDVHSQHEKERFNEITNFLRDVVDRPDAVLEIPYERDTILVHMDGRVLPIESLGTGIHEVVILAAAATVLSEHVVCIEEPELHLNPILQRKLIRYLSAHTNNQYFITTHSAVLMDVPDAEIYHIKLVNGCSVVERVTSGRQRSAVCEDLGYHPSDLLQANCIIWVEGPSDRIYLNWWLKSMAPDIDLVEGIQYSIMFYGGRLLSHLSNDDVEETDVNDFISLRKLNNRSVMLIDSDKENEDSDINATKSRLRDEFNSGPGHAWITEGREIENYLPAAWIEAAIKEIHPQAKKIGPFEKYDNTLKITGGKGKETQADKVKVARHITEQSQLDLSMYDLKAQLNKLIKFIRESNPAPASSEKKQQLPVSP
jgi:predicted ATP-dependent endonuclease of OLD family